MKPEQYTAFLQDILISIHANLHDAEDRRTFANPEELGYIEGKVMAYKEIMAILRTSADEFGIPRGDIGF